jgi:hypothetical protein
MVGGFLFIFLFMFFLCGFVSFFFISRKVAKAQRKILADLQTNFLADFCILQTALNKSAFHEVGFAYFFIS